MGRYYYIEIRGVEGSVKILHKSGCIKHVILQKEMEFLGTFYRPADALLTARKRYRGCVQCPRCCGPLS